MRISDWSSDVCSSDLVAGAADARFEAIRDYYANRKQAGSADPGSYRPVEPAQLYLNAEEWDARIGSHAAHLTTPFHEPESEQVVDFGVDNARDFAPERAKNAKVYEAVGKHNASLQREGKKVIIARQSVGAREQIGSTNV